MTDWSTHIHWIPHHNVVMVLHISIRVKYPLWLFVCYVHPVTQQYKLFEKHACNQGNHYERYDGAVRPSYCLKLKYPLPSSVSYVYTAVRIKNCLKSTSVATMKNMDNFHWAKEAMTCNHQINAFHHQQRWMEHKGGHL